MQSSKLKISCKSCIGIISNRAVETLRADFPGLDQGQCENTKSCNTRYQYNIMLNGSILSYYYSVVLMVAVCILRQG